MNHTRLESIFRKKHAPHMHAPHTRHTHAHHAHTHDSMYAHVYNHLAKFCYDRLNNSNFANKFVWVRKGANPHGPNRVWVPKSTPIVFNVGVGSHLT